MIFIGVILILIASFVGCSSHNVSNQEPVITTPLTASPSVVSLGDKVTLSVTANDPDDDTLVYQWAVTGGEVTGSGNTATWTLPPSAGVYTVTVLISDGTANVSDHIDVTVNASTPNSPPTVSITNDTGTTLLSCGDILSLTANGSDQDDDSLTYQWSENGETLGVDDTSSSISWTAPNTTGEYTISVTVSDGQATASADLTIEVTDNLPPRVSTVIYDAPYREVSTGRTINPSVIILDADNDPIIYSWSVTAGTLSGDISGTLNLVDQSGTSSIFWTVPNTTGQYTLTITYNDGIYPDKTEDIVYTVQ